MHDILGPRYRSICLANVGLGCIGRSDRPRRHDYCHTRMRGLSPETIGENKEETKRPALIGKFHSNLQELMPMPCHAMPCHAMRAVLWYLPYFQSNFNINHA